MNKEDNGSKRKQSRKSGLILPNQPQSGTNPILEMIKNIRGALGVLDKNQMLHRKKIVEYEGKITTLQNKVGELYDRVVDLEKGFKMNSELEKVAHDTTVAELEKHDGSIAELTSRLDTFGQNVEEAIEKEVEKERDRIEGDE